MATPRERVVEWLRDAFAAEEQAHTMLTRTARQVEGHAEFRSGLERHGHLSQSQADRIKACLESLGESTSALKNLTGQITAFAQTLSGYVVGDEPVKAVLATSTFAQMEVSSYRILVAGATAAGLNEVAGLCRTLLEEETGFAQWLEQQAPVVTRDYLIVQGADA
jgi:ferritin-like metal-binding protein YciE